LGPDVFRFILQIEVSFLLPPTFREYRVGPNLTLRARASSVRRLPRKVRESAHVFFFLR